MPYKLDEGCATTSLNRIGPTSSVTCTRAWQSTYGVILRLSQGPMITSVERVEEQFHPNLERLVEIKMPHTAGKVRVEIVRPGHPFQK